MEQQQAERKQTTAEASGCFSAGWRGSTAALYLLKKRMMSPWMWLTEDERVKPRL